MQQHVSNHTLVFWDINTSPTFHWWFCKDHNICINIYHVFPNFSGKQNPEITNILYTSFKKNPMSMVLDGLCIYSSSDISLSIIYTFICIIDCTKKLLPILRISQAVAKSNCNYTPPTHPTFKRSSSRIPNKVTTELIL